MPTFGEQRGGKFEDGYQVLPDAEAAADKLTDDNRDDDPEKKNEQPAHTQTQDNTKLLTRELLAKDFLAILIRNPDAQKPYSTPRPIVRLAFEYADRFIEEANQYRGECELEDLV